MHSGPIHKKSSSRMVHKSGRGTLNGSSQRQMLRQSAERSHPVNIREQKKKSSLVVPGPMGGYCIGIGVVCLLCRDFGFTTAVTCDCAPGIVAIVEEGSGEGACVGVRSGGGSETVLSR